LNIRVMTVSASSSRSMRSPIGGNSKPRPACSDSFHAAPMPRRARPWEITSSVVTIFASNAGLRYVTPVTSVPSLTFDVCAASADSVVYASSIGSVSGPTPRIW
jgi:hypothetical protein